MGKQGLTKGTIKCRHDDGTYDIDCEPGTKTGNTEDLLLNTEAEVTEAVDDHMKQAFGRNHLSWHTSHKYKIPHPITALDLAGRETREKLHAGTAKVKSGKCSISNPFNINTTDKHIHNVFSAFKFKTTKHPSTGATIPIIDHPKYAGLAKTVAAPITIDELDKCTNTKSKNKSPGGTDIKVMHIHLLPPKLRRAFIALCNVFVLTGSNPVQWNQCYIKLIPKEPNASTLDRMRPISLLEIPRKLVCDIKQRKIVNFWREAGIISPDQFAFTAGRSTAEAAMIKKLLADRAKHYKDNIVMLDIDLSQAYDTVEQWIVEVALRRMGTPYAFINMLTHLHSNHKVSTYTGYGSTPGIYPDRGACPQGAPESCAIFLASNNGHRTGDHKKGEHT